MSALVLARTRITGTRGPSTTMFETVTRRSHDTPVERRIGHPVVVGTFGGFFHAGADRARAAVLMLSPFGYEELCARATWRVFAEMLADAGLPSLRFDYPGTGDALDPAVIPADLEDWRQGVRDAAQRLKEASGCSHLILVGQGLGAALAAQAAREVEGIVASVLMAPVVSGRAHLRELRAWAKVMADGNGGLAEAAAADEAGSYVVAGLSLPAARAEAVKRIDLATLDVAPGRNVLIVSRPHTPVPKGLVDRLQGLGSTIATMPYDGYEALLSDPTQAVTPTDTLDAVVAWIDARAAELPATLTPRASGRGRTPPMPALIGDGFEETPMVFADGRLFGILCRPQIHVVDKPIVIFVGAGRDYHAGWGRSTVNQARALARQGLASFRFDITGTGDSPRTATAPDEMLYSTAQVADVTAAIDHCATLGFSTATVSGRCSGAYAAFNAAIDDDRVVNVILVNIARFVWTPGESVTESMTFAQRSLADLGATLLWRDGVRRLFKGQLRVKAASVFVTRRLAERAGRLFAFLPGSLTLQSRLYHDVHRRFRALRDTGRTVTLIYAAGDGCRAELQNYMGAQEKRLGAYPNVAVIEIPNADHNFTAGTAQGRLIEQTLSVLLERKRTTAPPTGCAARGRTDVSA